MKYLLTALMALYATSALAIPIGVICADSRGQITVAQKCAKSQTKISTQNLSSFGLRGPQGFQGPQGVQGIPGTNGTNGRNGADGENSGGLSQSNCHLRSFDITSSGGESSGTVVCLQSEVFISHGGYITSGFGFVLYVELRKVLGDTDKVAGVTYTFGSSVPYGATVQGWCCESS